MAIHNDELRYWTASGGVDPDRDVRRVVIAPPQMVAKLSARNIVGYCVGEPWNQGAVEMGIGRSVITKHEIWNNSPEKVFGVTREWADKHPNTHMAPMRALIEAAQWMDKPENRREVVKIITAGPYVNAPVHVVENSMTGIWMYTRQEGPLQMADFNVFYRYAATFPWRSHAVWFLTRMACWGRIDQVINFSKLAGQVYRPDIYRQAARAFSIAIPDIDYKTEGTLTA